MEHIPLITNHFMDSHTDFKTLVNALREEFAHTSVSTPMRHHHDYPNPEEEVDSTLLLMPSWQAGKDLGVKIVTVNPNNGRYDLPSIQGTYLYLDGHLGTVRALMDAKALTAKRTAAVSALAASYLARKDASTLLMLGTGALSGNLIRAHAAVRPLRKAYVWGRNPENSKLIAQQLEHEDIEVIPIDNYLDMLSKVDVISCATLSKDPLVFGKFLKPGQHLDLVGAYKTDMREADDEAVIRSRIFLDTYQGGLKESGDIVIPLQNGILKKEDINADLHELCSGSKKGRKLDSDITFFKSVGHASEDLIGARYFFEQWKKKETIKSNKRK